MRKKTFSRFLQGAVSMVMVASMLTGCGGSAASTSSSNASAETATTAADNVEYKDTLVVGEYGDSDSLDPQKNVSHDKIERELYEGLLEIDPDTGEFKGCLAESWEHSDDYMTWTFHLRKGVKFASSGKEMTSADVVATFDRLLDKEHPGRYYQNVEFIDTVTAPDDYTVVMTLAHAFGAVEDTLTQACTFILNKDYIDQYGDDMGFDPATIDGTGPYKLVSWDVDEQVVMEASENWWRGEAGTKNLIVKIIPEASSRAMAIETGEVDIIDRPGVDDANFVDASNTIWAVRGVKSPYEQDLLRKVNNINTKLYEHAYARIVPGVTTERGLYNSMVAEAYELGCDSMLEMDVRGHKTRYGLPNCPPSDLPFGTEDGTSIMIDGGPSYKGYFSDIIRVGIIGKPTAEQERLYKIALEGHAIGMSKLRAGVLISDVVAAVDAYYEKAGVSDINQTKGWVGHSIGLNVHEYPCLEAGEDTPLQAGMVMSMEPSLTTPTAGTMCLEQNFIVTETGYELLSKMPTELVRVY